MSVTTDLPKLWRGIDIKWSDDWAPDPAAIKYATRLLGVLDGRAKLPSSATRGYWPTVSFKWEGTGIEVEVFARHCELYHYKGNDLIGDEIPQFRASIAGAAPLLAVLRDPG